jgi:hypothetical protein
MGAVVLTTPRPAVSRPLPLPPVCEADNPKPGLPEGYPNDTFTLCYDGPGASDEFDCDPFGPGEGEFLCAGVQPFKCFFGADWVEQPSEDHCIYRTINECHYTEIASTYGCEYWVDS